MWLDDVVKGDGDEDERCAVARRLSLAFSILPGAPGPDSALVLVEGVRLRPSSP